MKHSTEKPKLPDGIEQQDLIRPAWDTEKAHDRLVEKWEDREFELWHTTGFGWCLPTLSISNKGQRTYAVVVAPEGRSVRGAVVRIGMGPHVTARHTVYVRKSREAALRPFLELRQAGAGRAGAIRDRISSRRAQGQEEREAGNRSWRWKA